MTDTFDRHFRRLRRRERPPVYSLADKPIYDWLHGSQISRLVVSINDIIEAMPAEVRDATTLMRLTKHIIPKFLRRIGMVQYPQVVRLLNGKRLRLWVRPNTIDTSHGYNVADQYEKVCDIQPERDVWEL